LANNRKISETGLKDIIVKNFGAPFGVGRVYSVKICVVVTQIVETWVSTTQFFREYT